MEAATRYQAIGLQNLAQIPQWETLDPVIRAATEVVGQVLPFRTNRYVTDHLIDEAYTSGGFRRHHLGRQTIAPRLTDTDARQ